MASVYCSNCKFWSELIAKAINLKVHALCLNKESENFQQYTSPNAVCSKQELGAPIDCPEVGPR